MCEFEGDDVSERLIVLGAGSNAVLYRGLAASARLLLWFLIRFPLIRRLNTLIGEEGRELTAKSK